MQHIFVELLSRFRKLNTYQILSKFYKELPKCICFPKYFSLSLSVSIILLTCVFQNTTCFLKIFVEMKLKIINLSRCRITHIVFHSICLHELFVYRSYTIIFCLKFLYLKKALSNIYSFAISYYVCETLLCCYMKF